MPLPGGLTKRVLLGILHTLGFLGQDNLRNIFSRLEVGVYEGKSSYARKRRAKLLGVCHKCFKVNNCCVRCSETAKLKREWKKDWVLNGLRKGTDAIPEPRLIHLLEGLGINTNN
uniref:RNA silencing suppressor n=1 Tax=Fig latent virus 1 TaxID=641245 RepID=C6GZ80_9VIRU|nr:nucleic acid binding protein [Fig latent virus 1]